MTEGWNNTDVTRGQQDGQLEEIYSRKHNEKDGVGFI